MTFSDENYMQNIILHNVRWPIPILVAKVWRRNLDCMKNLQAEYFSGENIPIYSIWTYSMCIYMAELAS